MGFVAGSEETGLAGRLGGSTSRDRGRLSENGKKAIAGSVGNRFGQPGRLTPSEAASRSPTGRSEENKARLREMAPSSLPLACAAQKGFPRPLNEAVAADSRAFKSFAAKIRHMTNDGWELVNAVYEVFTRARDAQASALILESATWLADRGFGKPVQVGQLLDAEGNAVAFTLWQPVAPVGLPAPQAEEAPDVIEHEAIQHPPEEYKHPVRVQEETDSLSAGPLKAWTTSKVDPISGEDA